MIIYGDPQFEISVYRCLETLEKRLETRGNSDIEEARSAVIQAGQIEQGIADWLEKNPNSTALISHVQKVTDFFAEKFFYGFTGKKTEVFAQKTDSVRALIKNLKSDFSADAEITLKIPEGFAFYALFPEQYILAAQKWADVHKSAEYRRVTIVGVRSIGTTLSAVVCAALANSSWNAKRFSVRPTGDPFQRRVQLPQCSEKSDFALVVDEGPGASGSSMAAVVQALVEAGISERNIALFPGHDGEPGGASTDEIRTIWKRTPRFTISLENLRWNGFSLSETLAQKSAELCKTSERFDSVKNLSGGLWRKFVFENENDWPAVSAQLELCKWLCQMRNAEFQSRPISKQQPEAPLGNTDVACQRTLELAEGNVLSQRERIEVRENAQLNKSVRDFCGSTVLSHPNPLPLGEGNSQRNALAITSANHVRQLAVLWKFAGLGPAPDFSRTLAEAQFDQIQRMAEQGFTAQPIGILRGFIALQWIPGKPLQKSDLNEIVLHRIADYLIASASDPLKKSERFFAAERLKQMLFVNCEKALDEKSAELARKLRGQIFWSQNFPSYTDGRMSPHKWIAAESGEILKTDAGGHDCDHTIIGKQPLYWDIAGVFVEWDLNGEQSELFLNLLAKNQIVAERVNLRFFCAAYAAFRMGQMIFSREIAAENPNENARFENAAEFYRSKLTELLS